MNNAEVLAEAEAVIAALYSPPALWSDRALLRLLRAAWYDAVDSNFITREDLA